VFDEFIKIVEQYSESIADVLDATRKWAAQVGDE
jgi:hypothetical protein